MCKKIVALAVLVLSGCASSVEIGPPSYGIRTEGKTHEEKVAIQKEIIAHQEVEKKSQNEEAKQLKRQQYYNERMKMLNEKGTVFEK